MLGRLHITFAFLKLARIGEIYLGYTVCDLDSFWEKTIFLSQSQVSWRVTFARCAQKSEGKTYRRIAH